MTSIQGEGRRTRVAILGCTGSIGTQALDVCRSARRQAPGCRSFRA